MSPSAVGLPEALERAASALPEHADAIRPANGDPVRLAEELGGEAGARVLTWLLENLPDDAVELVAAWVETPEIGAPHLLRVRPDDLPKAGRKLLRRAQHQLRSRGVEVPEESPAAVVAKLPPVEDSLEAACISPIDPSGTRVAYMVEANPSGGARLFEVMLDERRGVVEFEVYSAARGKVRRFLREFAMRDRFPALEAPVESVRALVARVAAAQPADRALPRAFSEWRSRVAEVPEGARTPGELARDALVPGGFEEGEQGDLLARVAELVKARELGPWPPADEALQRVAEKLGEIQKGAIIVSGARKRDQVDQALVDAAESVFAEAAAALTAQRFEESAFVLWKRGGEADARACLAAADAFRGGSPGENPVARAILEVLLAPVLAESEEDEEGSEPESLLVKP